MKKNLRSALALAALCCLGNYALAASFDCRQARTTKEKMICADAQLSALDEQLDASYKDALKRSGALKTVRQLQRSWLKNGDVANCASAACLTQAITARIQLLDSVATAQTPTARWNGSYVRFFNGARDSDAADLTLLGLHGNKVYAAGNAIWQGPNAAQGQVHTGEIDGVGQIKTGKVVFDLEDCSATLALTPAGLTVEDASGCGGMNVTFIGDYRKQ